MQQSTYAQITLKRLRTQYAYLIYDETERGVETMVDGKSIEDQERNQRHVALLDALNERFGMNDREVADLLKTKKGAICDVRANRRVLTFQQELRAYNHLGYAWARAAMLKLLPDEFQESLLEKDNARTKCISAEDAEEAGLHPPGSAQQYKSGPAT